VSQKRYGVTGVASGIGAQLAATLKAQGHVVVGYDLMPVSENVDSFIPLDLSDSDAIKAAVAATPAGLDGLCNNAGVPPRAGSEAAVLRVNLLGMRAFTEGLLDGMRAGASIVNMASRAGHNWADNLDQVKRLGQVHRLEGAQAFVDREQLDVMCGGSL